MVDVTFRYDKFMNCYEYIEKWFDSRLLDFRIYKVKPPPGDIDELRHEMHQYIFNTVNFCAPYRLDPDSDEFRAHTLKNFSNRRVMGDLNEFERELETKRNKARPAYEKHCIEGAYHFLNLEIEKTPGVIFEMQNMVKQWEIDHFGESHTNVLDPVKLVNMYVYIVGELFVHWYLDETWGAKNDN